MCEYCTKPRWFFFVISARKDGDVQASEGEDVPLPSRDVNLEK